MQGPPAFTVADVEPGKVDQRFERVARCLRAQGMGAQAGVDQQGVGVHPSLFAAQSFCMPGTWHRSLTGLAFDVGPDRSVREGCRRVLRAVRILRSWRAGSIVC